MAKALPPHPHLDWLKKSAKERLTELRTGNPDARLHDAQREIARDYGFASWRALKAEVDRLSVDGQIISAASEGRAHDLAMLLDAHPHKLALTGGQWKIPLLHLAASEGHLACVEDLLRRGFDPNTQDRLDHASALHWAAQSGHVAVVERLLAAGADIDGESDAHGMNVIGWATVFKHVHRAVADLLLARGAKPTIFSAVALDRGDLVHALVERDRTLLGARMIEIDFRRTPLHLAVLKNRPAMVKLLLELGADPHAKDERGNTPLNYAAARKDRTIADLLVAGGADARQRDLNRFEPVVPILSARNVDKALDHYVAVLGFHREWDWGNPPTFGCVMRGEAKLFVTEDDEDARGCVYLTVLNVDALYDEYKQRGVANLKPPENKPWGMREISVRDLDGNLLFFGGEAGVTTPSAEEP